jgi:hypothetical protein
MAQARKVTHPAVSMARGSLVNCFLLGTLMIWPALAAPSAWAVGLVGLVPLLVLFLQSYRLRRYEVIPDREGGVTIEPPITSAAELHAQRGTKPASEEDFEHLSADVPHDDEG